MTDWRVLIVEDDRTVARIHCRFVTGQAGFSVAGIASGGAQAREMVATLRPDLVLLDLGLPGVDGLALMRELRTAGQAVEVVVITASAHAETVRTAVQLGAVDYLVKPFWPARLRDALAAFTARMEALAERRLDQAAVDRVRTGAASRPGAAVASTIRGERLEEVKAALAARGQAVSAEELAALVGMARVTARRYLEHLVAAGECTVDQVADGPGRPRKAYRAWLSAPVGECAQAHAPAR